MSETLRTALKKRSIDTRVENMSSGEWWRGHPMDLLKMIPEKTLDLRVTSKVYFVISKGSGWDIEVEGVAE